MTVLFTEATEHSYLLIAQNGSVTELFFFFGDWLIYGWDTMDQYRRDYQNPPSFFRHRS